MAIIIFVQVEVLRRYQGHLHFFKWIRYVFFHNMIEELETSSELTTQDH